MATIVTVHGTFATGPLEGEKWWQRGSPFSAYLAHFVESDGGEIKIEPHIWNGLNSETSRRASGEALAATLTRLDEAGEPFVVLGHSHGGSVVSAALLTCAKMRRPLSAMQRWITVGTPFIKTTRQRFLFSRLGFFGKAVYLTLLTFFVLGLLALFGPAATLDEWYSGLLAIVLFGGPFALFYAGLRYLESRRSLRFNPRLLRYAEENFADRWLSLWHAKDEAVQSLKAVKRLDVKIFSRDFAASTLNLMAVIIIPVLCIWTLMSPAVMDVIAAHVLPILDAHPDDLYSAGGHNIFENAIVLLLALCFVPPSFLIPGFVYENPSPLTDFLLLSLGIAILIGAAVCLTWAFNFLARLISLGLSLLLNPMTLAQMRAVAYGSDTREDLAVDASEWPIWMSRGYPPMKGAAADDLEQASDVAIGHAIPKFRNVVENLAEADSPEATSDVLADYLTWPELIHTSYFTQERFAKLVAYAVCQCDGFRPSAHFVNDPEFAQVAQAYATIVEGAVVAAA